MPERDQSYPFPILIADIGGTNARFALLPDAEAAPVTFPVAATADYRNVDDAIRAVVLAHAAVPPRSAVIAVAGPVEGDEIELTNTHWVVRPRELMAELGFHDVLVLNDFEAQALAVAMLDEAGRRQIGHGTAAAGASRVVLGPGTGLGVAGLVRAGGLWVPVAGEGGHVDLGPRDRRDHELWPHLTPIKGRISAEQVVSGRGLVNLYTAISRADGCAPVHETPAAITGAALAGSDARAVEAVNRFALYLSRLAGDLALVFMARGGVFIGGGIMERILPILDANALRAAFEDKAPHEELLGTIPFFLITESLPALSGLASFARAPHLFGVETADRRWRD